MSPREDSTNYLLDEVLFHEDEWKQIELIPIANLPHILASFEEIRDVTDNGTLFGFTKILQRKVVPELLELKSIPFQTMFEALDRSASNFCAKLYSGYSTTREYRDNSVVWGFERFGIVVEFTMETVNSIWLLQNSKFKFTSDCTSLRNALGFLLDRFDLVLVDWNKTIMCPPNDQKRLDDYLFTTLKFKDER